MKNFANIFRNYTKSSPRSGLSLTKFWLKFVNPWRYIQKRRKTTKITISQEEKGDLHTWVTGVFHMYIPT